MEHKSYKCHKPHGHHNVNVLECTVDTSSSVRNEQFSFHRPIDVFSSGLYLQTFPSHLQVRNWGYKLDKNIL